MAKSGFACEGLLVTGGEAALVGVAGRGPIVAAGAEVFVGGRFTLNTVLLEDDNGLVISPALFLPNVVAVVLK